MVRSIAWLVVVAACSGHPDKPTHPKGSNAPSDAATPAITAPTERECEDLIAHVVAIGMADLRGKPAGQLPTEAEQAKTAADLREQFLPGCRALARDAYRCALAATTYTELGACHATPSNSTSNSSVAPGGMAPPAPRSP